MDFVVERNIARFRKMLESETAPAKRAVLVSLLRAEEAKLVALPDPPPMPGH